MRSPGALQTETTLIRGGHRRQAMRLRWRIVAGLLALGFAGGLAGTLTAPVADTAQTTGPFSYFPSE